MIASFPCCYWQLCFSDTEEGSSSSHFHRVIASTESVGRVAVNGALPGKENAVSPGKDTGA